MSVPIVGVKFLFGLLSLDELRRLLDKQYWTEYKFIANPSEWLKVVDSTGKLWYPITDEKGEKIIKLWACKIATQEDVDRTAGNERPFKLGDEFCDETDEVLFQKYFRVVYSYPNQSSIGSDKFATVKAVNADEACAKVREILEKPNLEIEAVYAGHPRCGNYSDECPCWGEIEIIGKVGDERLEACQGHKFLIDTGKYNPAPK